jgi:hypothetical protein
VATRLQRAKRPRVDWGALLRELPVRFATKEAAEKAGTSLTHVYAAVSRWMKAKKITKDTRGFRKISAVSSEEQRLRSTIAADTEEETLRCPDLFSAAPAFYP